jgi:hypothetical protein
MPFDDDTAVDKFAVLDQNTTSTLTSSPCGYSTRKHLARSSWLYALRAEKMLAERYR